MTAMPAMSAAGARPARGRRRGNTVRRVVGFVSLGWIVVVILGCVLAPVLAPRDPRAQDLLAVLKGPSAQHLLGTDTLGRDILSRLMYGAAPTLIGVAIAIAIYVVLGVVLGLSAGYVGGWMDRGVSGLTSVLVAMPHIIVLFVVLAIYRNNTYLAMTVFGLLSSPVMVLLVRSSALAVRNELFVDAARVSGLSAFAILVRHVFPRTIGLIVVQGAVFGANAIVVESVLSFLGFGVQPPDPSWGNMVAEAATQISLNPWMLYPTGGTIALTAIALGFVGDLLRDRVAGGWTETTLTGALRRSDAAAFVPAAASGAALLSVRALSVGHPVLGSVTPIVTDVSFDVRRGETLGLVGESGSGKTTVAFGVLGVVGDALDVTGGAVVFDGVNLLTLDERRRAAYRGKRIAYVAQEPMVALDPNYRIGRQLAELVRRNDGLRGGELKTRVIELLRMVELRDPEATARKYPHELSGGMAQRVAIACALSGRPDLLVADEPTTALDVTVQAAILGLLMRLRDRGGLSMLIITHDWGVVADICDHVAVMYRGEIVEQAPVAEIFSAPRHAYTRALLASNPHGARPGTDLPVVTGAFSTPYMERAAGGSAS